VQGWTGRDNDQRVSHGEGLSYLLEAMESGQSSDQQSSDEFQDTIRVTLYVPVVSSRVILGSTLIRMSTYYICLSRFWKLFLTLGYG
jgi:hypothetical protein